MYKAGACQIYIPGLLILFNYQNDDDAGFPVNLFSSGIKI